MSEYMEKHTVSRLVGSPPGYVGYDEGGQLTEKIRRRPYSVVLFDEIEKAHPDVFNMLLQILDDGILTDAQGRTVSFKNAVIIMTSNVGARLITDRKGSLGFAYDNSSMSEEKIRDAVMGELKNTFRPEFLNRVDDIIVFSRLTKENIKEIAAKMLDKVKGIAEEIGVKVSFSPEVIEKIAEAGFDEVYGARPLKRTIQSKIEDRLSELILEGAVKANNEYECRHKDGERLEKVGGEERKKSIPSTATTGKEYKKERFCRSFYFFVIPATAALRLLRASQSLWAVIAKRHIELDCLSLFSPKSLVNLKDFLKVS